jgi:hypothetical protein
VQSTPSTNFAAVAESLQSMRQKSYVITLKELSYGYG